MQTTVQESCFGRPRLPERIMVALITPFWGPATIRPDAAQSTLDISGESSTANSRILLTSNIADVLLHSVLVISELSQGNRTTYVRRY